MKKLLALTLGIVMIFSISAVSFAAVTELANLETTPNVGNSTQGIKKVEFNDSTNEIIVTAAGLVGQGTVLSHLDSDISLSGDTNIQYIDQKANESGDTVFTFQMKTTPTAGQEYTIKVGGTNVASAYSTRVKPIASTASGFTLTGSVTNAADTLVMFDDAGSDGSFDDALNAGFATVVSLYPLEAFSLETFVTEDLAVPSYTAVVGESKNFTIPNVLEGAYYLKILRPGYIAYQAFVEVTQNASLGTFTLLPGDVTEDTNAGDDDITTIYANSGASWYTNFGEGEDSGMYYYYRYDVDCNLSADSEDVTEIYKNYGGTGYDYPDDVLIGLIIAASEG